MISPFLDQQVPQLERGERYGKLLGFVFCPTTNAPRKDDLNPRLQVSSLAKMGKMGRMGRTEEMAEMAEQAPQDFRGHEELKVDFTDRTMDASPMCLPDEPSPITHIRPSIHTCHTTFIR